MPGEIVFALAGALLIIIGLVAVVKRLPWNLGSREPIDPDDYRNDLPSPLGGTCTGPGEAAGFEKMFERMNRGEE